MSSSTEDRPWERLGGGLRGGSVGALEIVLAHISVSTIAVHAFYAPVCKVLTGVVIFRASLSVHPGIRAQPFSLAQGTGRRTIQRLLLIYPKHRHRLPAQADPLTVPKRPCCCLNKSCMGQACRCRCRATIAMLLGCLIDNAVLTLFVAFFSLFRQFAWQLMVETPRHRSCGILQLIRTALSCRNIDISI